MRAGRHAAFLAGDYPNAFRMRWRALRSPGVPPRFAEGDGRPVLILPGIYETWHYLRPVAELLNAAGHPVHVLLALGLNGRPIPATAEAAAALLAERDLRDVVIVAHSKGGIVGKYLLTMDGPRERIRQLIAIASPFSGSSMARLVPVRGLREFLPDDAVLHRLAETTEVNDRITSIYPSFDPHIPEGSWLDGARNIELPTVGHFRILLQPQLLDAVRAEVDRL